MTPVDIDALLRETEDTLLSLTPTITAETETLEDRDLENVIAFQQECERRLNDLTEEKVAVRGGRAGEGEDDVTGEEGLAGVEERRGGRGRKDEEERKERGSNGRRGEAEEDGQERSGGEKDAVRKAVNDGKERKESAAEGQEDQSEDEKTGRTDIKEEEEKEVMIAQKSLLAVANDLIELQPPHSEGRSVRPKSKLGPRKSSEFHKSNNDPFGKGQRVTEKPRLLSPKSSINFTMNNLKQELTYLLDMFLQDPEKSGDDANFIEATTTSYNTTKATTPITTNTTTKDTSPTANNITATPSTPKSTDITDSATTPTATNITNTATTPTTTATDITTTVTKFSNTATNITTLTNTASPLASPLHPPNTTYETITSYPSTSTIDTSITTPSNTPPPLSTTSTDSHVFIYPSSPSFSVPISPHGEKDNHNQHNDQGRSFSFSSIVGGVKNLGWRNSLRRKKKRRNLVISDPQDFRQLKATTSIKPDVHLIDLRGTGNGTPGENETRNGRARRGTWYGKVGEEMQ